MSLTSDGIRSQLTWSILKDKAAKKTPLLVTNMPRCSCIHVLLSLRFVGKLSKPNSCLLSGLAGRILCSPRSSSLMRFLGIIWKKGGSIFLTVASKLRRVLLNFRLRMFITKGFRTWLSR